jgi:hypothetical protein
MVEIAAQAFQFVGQTTVNYIWEFDIHRELPAS